MARSRNIKPSLFLSEDLGTADPLMTILFIGLWCLADKAGRLEDRPLRIKAEIFPYREGIDLNGYLTELSRLGYILCFEHSGKRYIQVVNFTKHQNPHHTEKPSIIPAFSDGCTITRVSPLIHGDDPADSGFLIPDSCITTTTATRTEIIFRQTFDLREKVIRETFPDLDFNAEKEVCIAHYATQPPPIDPYQVIMKWFHRSKGGANAFPQSKSAAADVFGGGDSRLKRNTEAARQAGQMLGVDIG